jgi:hypothetical protein
VSKGWFRNSRLGDGGTKKNKKKILGIFKKKRFFDNII